MKERDDPLFRAGLQHRVTGLPVVGEKTLHRGMELEATDPEVAHQTLHFARAGLALRLFAADPARFRGITLRARSGPVRDTFLEAAHRALGPLLKLHPAMPRDALLGGLDFAQTLATGTLTTSE